MEVEGCYVYYVSRVTCFDVYCFFLSPSRNAVKNVRNKADELIRSLNPKFNEKQKVVPVFRWSQNDG